MQLRFTKSFESEYKKIIKGNEVLKVKINRQLNTLQENTNHPSLRLHKVKSEPFWSVSVDRSIRLLIIIEKNSIYVFHVGKHEDVYK